MTVETMRDRDLVLRGGRVFDGTSWHEGQSDVLIRSGRVAEIGPALDAAGALEVDCDGKLVVPGLIDMHVHVFEGATTIGLNPSDAAFTRGVVAVADAGSAGTAAFPLFRSHIAEPADGRVLSFLNVSSIGLVDIRHGELLDPSAIHAEDIERIVSENRDVVRGLKVRLSRNAAGDDPLTILRTVLEIAERVSVPVMVHIGNTTCTLSEIVELLREGDIVTHMYTGSTNGLFEGDDIPAAVRAARARGVLFEIGHGRTQIVYSIAKRALDLDFAPDVISSDISNGNWNGPSFDLATVASKLIALGMETTDALAALTSRPAEILGIADEGYGYLRPGSDAYVTVLDPLEQSDTLPDSAGDSIDVARLEPVLSVRRDRLVETVPWRGYAALAIQPR